MSQKWMFFLEDTELMQVKQFTTILSLFPSKCTKRIHSQWDYIRLSYEHTELQASASAVRSHWNALWRSKMGPRSIPKRHGKHQNFKAATRCVYTLNE